MDINTILKHLLDFSKRNRLLNYKETGMRSVSILNKNIVDVFNNLVDGKTYNILPIDNILSKYNIDDTKNQKYINDEVNKVLKSTIKKNELLCYKEGVLLKRLMKRLYTEYRLSIDEKGINSLYVFFGIVNYKINNITYKAPLLLIPINMFINHEIYSISIADEEIILNPTLEFYYKQNYGITIPKYKEEELTIYLKKAQEVFKNDEEVILSSGIGIFNYQKMIMYMDLKQNKDILLKNINVEKLLGHDQKINANDDLELYPVVDYDSSQLEAIKLAASGASFTLEGPPGSGKSQTITNIIATLIGNGKKVLFVSEKQAALNVVYENLKKVGLDEFAIELHSNKANKKTFIEEVYTTAIKEKYIVKEESNNIIYNYDILNEKIKNYYYALHNKVIDNKYSFYDLYLDYASIKLDCINYRVNFENYKYKDLNNLCSILTTYQQELETFKTNDYKDIPFYGLNNLNHDYIEYSFIDDLNKSSYYLTKINEIISSIDFILVNNHKVSSVSEFYDLMDYVHLLTKLDRTPKVYFNKEERQKAKDLLLSYQLKNDILKKNKVVMQYDELVFDLDLKDIYETLKDKEDKFFKFLNKDYKRALKKINIYRNKKGKHLSSEVRELISFKDKSLENKEILDKLKLDIKDITPDNINDIVDEINELNEKDKYVLTKEYNLVKDKILDAIINYKRYNDEYYNLKNIQSHYDIDIMNMNINLLIDKFNKILESKELLKDYIYLVDSINKIKENNLIDFVEYYRENNYDIKNIPNQFKKNYLHTYLLYLLDLDPTLYNFRTKETKNDIEELKELDNKIKDINISKIISKLSSKRPDDVLLDGSSCSILAKEYKKLKKLKPIRMLLDEIGEFIFDIKPLFLMSPLSVSTYLQNDTSLFDYVIFDEASQIFASDSIGAIYRSKRCIIIGDSRQMPPSNFFNTSDDEEEGYEEGNESILSLASTTFTSCSLKWHYRSRSEELITFSNKEFYNNSLISMPSAKKHEEGFGIDYVYLENGVYDSKYRTNKVEAEYITDLIIKHYTNSNQSLGVVAFSKVQADLISDLLDIKLLTHPSVKQKIDNILVEPLFIKNIETVQGDERDRIIFSVCYGHNEYNKFYQHFGPINNLGGERRLNVAITRAKYNITVVSSIHSYEIKQSESVGANSLKKYLNYCENVWGAKTTSETKDSIILSVKEFLEGNGYRVDTNLGNSTFKIDLAVLDKKQDNYILAIMSDKKSEINVKDEIILEDILLNRMGFKYYKLFSLSWMNERKLVEEELLKLLNTGSEIKTEFNHESYLEKTNDTKCEMLDYNELSIDYYKDIYNNSDISNVIYEIIKNEEPITINYLYKKVASILDKTRVSNVIKNLVNQNIIDYNIDNNMFNNIVFIDKKESLFRSNSNRSIDDIPLSEIKDGLYIIIKKNPGITISGCYKAFLELINVKKIIENTKRILDYAIVMLQLDLKIEKREDKLYS